MELEVAPKLKTKKGYSLPNSYMVLYGLPTHSNRLRIDWIRTRGHTSMYNLASFLQEFPIRF